MILPQHIGIRSPQFGCLSEAYMHKGETSNSVWYCKLQKFAGTASVPVVPYASSETYKVEPIKNMFNPFLFPTRIIARCRLNCDTKSL